MKKRTTIKSRIGVAVRVAKADARFRRVRDASDSGESIEDAASLVGMTVAGVKAMIRRKTGSTSWPIKIGLQVQ